MQNGRVDHENKERGKPNSKHENGSDQPYTRTSSHSPMELYLGKTDRATQGNLVNSV